MKSSATTPTQAQTPAPSKNETSNADGSGCLSILKSEFANRKLRNNRYSLRAFAKYLSVHPSSLCRVLREQESLSLKTVLSICQKLEIGNSKRADLLARSTAEKIEAALRELAISAETDFILEAKVSSRYFESPQVQLSILKSARTPEGVEWSEAYISASPVRRDC